MKLIKNKAYESERQRRKFYYDGENLFNYLGMVETEIPTDLRRSPENDKRVKYYVLLGHNKTAMDNHTFAAPKNGTVVRVYEDNGGFHYGIVMDGAIIEQDGHKGKAAYFAFEKIRPSQEQRKALEAVYKNQVEKNKTSEKIKALEQEMKALREKDKDLNDKVSQSFSLLSRREFEKVFQDNLPQWLKEEMLTKGYEIEHFGCYYHDSIVIEREKLIEKWHESCMVRREYDDTSYLDTRSPEAKKLAESYIRRYTNPLSIKMKADSRLSLGDKRWLTLYESYYLPVNELSKEEAIKLAEKFSEE